MNAALRVWIGTAALGLAITCGPATAAPCGGFTDVDSLDPHTGPFCESVTWMKNRGITLGCTTTLYCPDDFVTRLQMAAFLKRLADKSTVPIWVDGNGKAVGPSVGSTSGYWRTPYGSAILRFDFPVALNRGIWNRSASDVHPFYTSVNCLGQAYVQESSIKSLPVQFYWRANQYRLMRVQQLVAPAPLPGLIYNAGVAFATQWTGNEASSACQVIQVNITDLFVPADDLADVTNEFVEPFRLE